MDDRTVDLIFAGSLESLPTVSSKIVRIFTSSTFTGRMTAFSHLSALPVCLHAALLLALLQQLHGFKSTFISYVFAPLVGS
jgi:hypothetical protein